MIQKVFYFPQIFPIFQEAHDFFVNTKKQTATQHLFTNKQLRTLQFPQFLSLMQSTF
jgi:hypothetical protein